MISHLGEQKVCLTMIVKNEEGSNEAHCIIRCLESCRQLISAVCIVFTSEEKIRLWTVDALVKNWCFDNRIEFYSQNFVWTGDFSAARNRSMEIARQKFGETHQWLLLIDSDEELVTENAADIKNSLKNFGVESYTIPLVMNGQLVPRVNLVPNEAGWVYRYRHHESIEIRGRSPMSCLLGNCDSPLAGHHIITKNDGARANDPEKNRKDLEVLDTAWEETRNPRYLFYAGMTRMNCNLVEESISTFLRFIKVANPEKDDRIMCYEGALCLARMLIRGTTPENAAEHLEAAKQFLFAAMDICPDRNEALCELATLYGIAGQWNQARIYALAAISNPTPKHVGYVEPKWKEWRALDILSCAFINMGWIDLAIPCLKELASRPALPAVEHKRIAEHLAMLEEPCAKP